ncbi:MAG: GAF domain-containing protein, partial [Anaerolineales bacterium]|nr:GAF domain-containing protein [Anaerolineales bacterium]
MKQSSSKQISPLQRLLSLSLNLRAKLVVGNMLITFIAITGMGYYVYYRAQETNNYITSQLEQSVRQKAEEKLANTVDKQATQLDFFFSSRSKDVTLIGESVARLLQQETSFNSGTYWDATQALARLPNGSWDNANTEAAAIFIPAKNDLTPALTSELNTLKYTEATVPLILEANPELIAIYFGGLLGETVYYPNIDLANIVPPDFDVTQRPWFIDAAPAQNPERTVIWSEPYLDAALNGFVVTSSIPVFDTGGNLRGVAAMDIQLNVITDIASNIRVGTTGYAFLVDKNNRLIAFPQAGYNDFGATPETLPLGETISKEKLAAIPDDFFSILSKVSAGQSGLATITIGSLERFIAYRPIPEIGYGLIILVPAEELQTEVKTTSEQIAIETRNTISLSVLLVIAILVAASVIALAMGNALTAPLKTLTNTAQEIAGGNLEARVEIKSQDEIGILAKTLNSMTSTLSGLIQSLEQRVAERTTDLEIARQQSERRVRELQTIGEMSSIIASEQKVETLLPLVTRLVSERFDFYHVGIFLVDETGQWAVLQAANSDGGQSMLARGHKLEVGAIGIVGYVTQNGMPRIALDVGVDPVFFNNPDLPTTRSEMALPLNVRGRIIGALDVQSTRPGAFTEDDASTLGILTDQIAISIENARLFGRTQSALAEVQSLYRQDIVMNWAKFAQDEDIVGYHKSLTEAKLINQAMDTDEIRQTLKRGSVSMFNAGQKRTESTLVVPVKLHGQVIGVINIQATKKEHQWTFDEISLAEAISERLALALENARL